MLACVYGRLFAPFVEPIAGALRSSAQAAGSDIMPIPLETALAAQRSFTSITGLYVLPFDAPPSHSADTPAQLIHALFPNAQLAVSFAVQDLCWDKIATQERLVERGVPVPDTLITTSPDDVRAFVREHEFAILKERFSCGGQGHIVAWYEDGRLVGDSGSHQYDIMLTSGGQRRLTQQQLIYPGPFYVQRLLADAGPRGVIPGQVMRAYVVDHEIPFWTERYREHYARPSDWIVNVRRGAKYRLVQSVSEEAKKIALRAADAAGVRIGAVDLIRTSRGGTYVLEVDTDGAHMVIDRSFKHMPEYRDYFDLDRWIAEALISGTLGSAAPASAAGAPA